jgi:hypothetical protein
MEYNGQDLQTVFSAKGSPLAAFFRRSGGRCQNAASNRQVSICFINANRW